ncbi:hypothetical protein GCM10027194_33680 [Thalassiella azotivora]
MTRWSSLHVVAVVFSASVVVWPGKPAGSRITAGIVVLLFAADALQQWARRRREAPGLDDGKDLT